MKAHYTGHKKQELFCFSRVIQNHNGMIFAKIRCGFEQNLKTKFKQREL